VYRLIVVTAEEEPSFDPDSDKVYWEPAGSSASEIMAEIVECDDFTVAEDIVGILGEKNSYAVIKDGDFDWFDDTSSAYQIRVPRDPHFRETWASFRNSIQHHGRFFNEAATALLKEILDPLVKGEWPRNGSAVRLITPTTEDRFIYRGRQAIGESARGRIYQSPIRELGAPPPQLNIAGRMNPTGISTFYGSFDSRTCVAELRVPVGGEAVIGKFEIIRPIRVLDLTTLEGASYRASYFVDDFLRIHAYNEFIRGFHDEIKRAVLPGTEPLEYLPTQFVAEFLWARGQPRLDGLIYGSSQLSDGSKNIVLFPHASYVEGGWAEKPREVKRIYTMADEDGPGDEVIVLEHDVNASGPSHPEPNATLRLDQGAITVARVHAIRIEADERPVRAARDYSEEELPF
jgi:hypothetical protein